MSEYLPQTYLEFRETYPEVSAALDHLGGAVDDAGPLDAKTGRLVKLAIAIGALAEGAEPTFAKHSPPALRTMRSARSP